jgi:hypothetical protein
MELGRVGGEIRSALESGGVLELDVGVFLGDLEGRLHEAERGGEDQAVPGSGKLLDSALGIRFRHAFHIGGLDLVAERLLDRLAADVMLVAPAMVAHRAHIDEADFQLLLSGCTAGRQGQGGGPCQNADETPRNHVCSLGLVSVHPLQVPALLATEMLHTISPLCLSVRHERRA